MKTIERERFVTFETVPVGDVFVLEKKVYQRIEELYCTDGRTYNAVECSNGKLCYFSNYVDVYHKPEATLKF